MSATVLPLPHLGPQARALLDRIVASGQQGVFRNQVAEWVLARLVELGYVEQHPLDSGALVHTPSGLYRWQIELMAEERRAAAQLRRQLVRQHVEAGASGRALVPVGPPAMRIAEIGIAGGPVIQALPAIAGPTAPVSAAARRDARKNSRYTLAAALAAATSLAVLWLSSLGPSDPWNLFQHANPHAQLAAQAVVSRQHAPPATAVIRHAVVTPPTPAARVEPVAEVRRPPAAAPAKAAPAEPAVIPPPAAAEDHVTHAAARQALPSPPATPAAAVIATPVAPAKPAAKPRQPATRLAMLPASLLEEAPGEPAPRRAATQTGSRPPPQPTSRSIEPVDQPLTSPKAQPESSLARTPAAAPAKPPAAAVAQGSAASSSVAAKPPPPAVADRPAKAAAQHILADKPPVAPHVRQVAAREDVAPHPEKTIRKPPATAARHAVARKRLTGHAEVERLNQESLADARKGLEWRPTTPTKAAAPAHLTGLAAILSRL